MIKLLIVANELAGGGAERVLIMFLEALRPPEYVVDLLLVRNKGVYMSAVPAHINVITMIDVKHGDVPFPTKVEQLEGYCREHLRTDYDIEVAFLEGPPTKLISYHTNTQAYKLAWVHTDLMNVHWTYAYYSSDEEERAAYERFDEIVFVSEGCREAFFQRFGQMVLPSSVITNPTDIDTILQRSTEFYVPRYPFCFCIIASLCARKGQGRLLHAMGRLFKEGFRFHLNMVGEGNNTSYLKELSHILNIHDYVHFLGFQPNPYPYMASCDVVVSSSISEGFPLVLCEALCLQKPILATCCTGNRDVLRNGRFGLLLDNTEEGLYQGMKRVITDEALLFDLKQRSALGKDSLQFNDTIKQDRKSVV